jgi:hypothetical protein
MESQTTRWKALKKTYVSLPRLGRPAFAALNALPEEAKSALSAAVRGRPMPVVDVSASGTTNRNASVDGRRRCRPPAVSYTYDPVYPSLVGAALTAASMAI